MSLTSEAKQDVAWWLNNIDSATNDIYTQWSEEESELHINVLELKAVLFWYEISC